METQFIIAGPIQNEEQLWWNNHQGWISGLENATTLPKQILTSPLPPGGVGVMEITMNMEFVAYYARVPTGMVARLNKSDFE